MWQPSLESIVSIAIGGAIGCALVWVENFIRNGRRIADDAIQATEQPSSVPWHRRRRP